MSLAHLQLLEQRELIAFLISIQTEKDEEFKGTLARKIDDKTPSNWVEFGEIKSRLSE